MSVPYTGRWFAVPVTGQPDTMEPATDPWQARAAVEAEIATRPALAGATVGTPQLASPDQVEAWARRQEAAQRDGVKLSPRSILKLEIWRGQPNQPHTRTDDRPAWSRRPEPETTSALRFTLHTLALVVWPATLATITAATLWTIGTLMLPQWWAAWSVLVIVTAAFLGLLATSWLNRLDPQGDTMRPSKFCVQCRGRVPAGHRHPRQRNYRDENDRRSILKAYVEVNGMWCPGTEWCDTPGVGHVADLTVDHLTPQAHGGTLNDGHRVICRTANSRRGTKDARPASS